MSRKVSLKGITRAKAFQVHLLPPSVMSRLYVMRCGQICVAKDLQRCKAAAAACKRVVSNPKMRPMLPGLCCDAVCLLCRL